MNFEQYAFHRGKYMLAILLERIARHEASKHRPKPEKGKKPPVPIVLGKPCEVAGGRIDGLSPANWARKGATRAQALLAVREAKKWRLDDKFDAVWRAYCEHYRKE